MEDLNVTELKEQTAKPSFTEKRKATMQTLLKGGRLKKMHDMYTTFINKGNLCKR